MCLNLLYAPRGAKRIDDDLVNQGKCSNSFAIIKEKSRTKTSQSAAVVHKKPNFKVV